MKAPKITNTATLNYSEVSEDIIHDIDGSELFETFRNQDFRIYSIKSLHTTGKGINSDVKMKMQNLKKQLKGYKQFMIKMQY